VLLLVPFFYAYTLVLIYYLSALNSFKRALKGYLNVYLYTLISFISVNLC